MVTLNDVMQIGSMKMTQLKCCWRIEKLVYKDTWKYSAHVLLNPITSGLKQSFKKASDNWKISGGFERRKRFNVYSK